MKDIFKILLGYKLTPNHLMVLLYFRDKEAPPLVNIFQERRALIDGEWLDDANNLTAKAIVLLGEIDAMVKKIKPSKIDIAVGASDDAQIDKYLALFPSGKLPSGKPARVSKAGLKDCFRWFFATFPYSWETVLKATDSYVAQYESKGYMFMRNSQYFVSKTGNDRVRTSDLADYCAMVETGTLEKPDDHFSEKVV